VTAVEQGLAELEEFGAGDDWAANIVEAAAFRHIATRRDCLGYCITSSGRVVCGMCGWSLSARMEDVGEIRSAEFAHFALATIGAAIAPTVCMRRYPMGDPLLVGEIAAIDDQGRAVFCRYAGRVVHRDAQGVVIDTRDL
jgi:hypothetical protein